jgi:hypothetical protein
MIDDVSKILRHVLLNQVPDLRVPGSAGVSADQVRFDPPDSAFRAYTSGVVVDVGTATVRAPMLNVYLVDLRENRTLRSNAVDRREIDGAVVDEPAPVRVNCHYLVTAWVPGDPATNHEPALDEQGLLHQVMVALFRNAPLNPARIQPPFTSPLPGSIQDVDLPLEVVPVDGFARLGEFWSAMGATSRWLPAVYAVVTVPVAHETRIAGPLVTTKATAFAVNGATETFFQIGGVVEDGGGNRLAQAWVRLESATGVALAVTGSDGAGRFDFDGLAAGTYAIRVRARGRAEQQTAVTVPSPAGQYVVSG